MITPRPRRLFVDAEAELIDPVTGRVVGMLYRWNTGERQKQWVDGQRRKNFKLRPLTKVDADAVAS